MLKTYMKIRIVMISFHSVIVSFDLRGDVTTPQKKNNLYNVLENIQHMVVAVHPLRSSKSQLPTSLWLSRIIDFEVSPKHPNSTPLFREEPLHTFRHRNCNSEIKNMKSTFPHI